MFTGLTLSVQLSKNKLPFKLLKPQRIYRPHTSEFKFIPKYKLFFHWKNFEKHDLLYSTLKQVKHYEIRAKLGQKCLPLK